MRAIYSGVLWAFALSGCQLAQHLQQAEQHFQSEDQQSKLALQHLEHSVRTKALTQSITEPWVVGVAQPLARDVLLPAAFQEQVATTLIFQAQGLLLDQIAERLTMATSIPVRVQPEALLASDAFLPLSSQAGFSALNQRRLRLNNAPEPLAASLDRISAFFDVSWRFEGHFIEFYKVETRAFQVQALSLNASSYASVGNQSDANSSGFLSQSGTELQQAESDELESLKQRLALFMTHAGRIVAAQGGNQTLVISDTPYALDAIARFVQRENQGLTRRVRLVFEEITISARTQAELNIDWNVVFNSARIAAGVGVVGLGSTALQHLGASIEQGPFNQSEAFIKALSEVAQVARRHSIPVLSLNRRPVTHALRTTFSYIDKIETTPYTSGTGLTNNAVSLSQKEETVGSILTLVPDIQADGQVLLSVAYDNTVAQPLKTITVGAADQGMQVQQVTIEGSATVQQVLLRPGQPLVVSGFDHTEQQQADKRLNPGVPLLFGGGSRVQQDYYRTLLIVTAQVEEN